MSGHKDLIKFLWARKEYRPSHSFTNSDVYTWCIASLCKYEFLAPSKTIVYMEFQTEEPVIRLIMYSSEQDCTLRNIKISIQASITGATIMR